MQQCIGANVSGFRLIRLGKLGTDIECMKLMSHFGCFSLIRKVVIHRFGQKIKVTMIATTNFVSLILNLSV